MFRITVPHFSPLDRGNKYVSIFYYVSKARKCIIVPNKIWIHDNIRIVYNFSVRICTFIVPLLFEMEMKISILSRISCRRQRNLVLRYSFHYCPPSEMLCLENKNFEFFFKWELNRQQTLNMLSISVTVRQESVY